MQSVLSAPSIFIQIWVNRLNRIKDASEWARLSMFGNKCPDNNYIPIINKYELKIKEQLCSHLKVDGISSTINDYDIHLSNYNTLFTLSIG